MNEINKSERMFNSATPIDNDPVVQKANDVSRALMNEMDYKEIDRFLCNLILNLQSARLEDIKNIKIELEIRSHVVDEFEKSLCQYPYLVK